MIGVHHGWQLPALIAWMCRFKRSVDSLADATLFGLKPARRMARDVEALYRIVLRANCRLL